MASHDKTLNAVFEKPARGDIPWRNIEAMFQHLGAEITEGSGSRVRVRLNGVNAVFHRPHPRKEPSKACVKKVREFLQTVGVEPNA
jgi:HicA toxin of bacterial toxin-antitoxin,